MVLNDTDEDWSAHFTIARRGFDGAMLAQERWSVVVPARGVERRDIGAEVVTPTDPARELIRVTSATARSDWFFAEPRDSALPVASAGVVARPRATGWVVEITAETIIRDLTLLVDRIDPEAETDEALVTLLLARPRSSLFVGPWRRSPRRSLIGSCCARPTICSRADDGDRQG